MLTDTPGSPAQRLAVTFLAEYQPAIGRPIPTAVISNVLNGVGVSGDAVRKALSRLVAGGLIVRARSGRTTSYALSATGRQEVADSTGRILAFEGPQPWDGEWTLIAFSMGGQDPDGLRHRLRSTIRPIGFALLYDGLWCAAHASIDDARQILDEIGVENAMVFRGRLDMTVAAAERLRSAWDIEALRALYEGFIERFSALPSLIERGEVAPGEALSARVRILDEWRAFPRIDPGLPPQLLGDSWPREAARALFSECYSSLAKPAESRLRQLIERYERP